MSGAGVLARWKPLEDWTPGDHVVYRRTGAKPENPAYVERRRQVLADVGFDEDVSAPLEQPADHAERKHGGTR